MPAYRTVYDWQKANDGFSASIACAREEGFDAIAVDCLHIADETGRDTKLVGEEGAEREVCDSEWISRSKLRVETRLKLLAKWDPKRYGDKVLTEVSGPEGGPIPLDETAMAARMAALLTLAAHRKAADEGE